ncbi:Centromere/kinetochore protein zw10-like [Holothuria leucospilota]|uniref:Centromere/kinetochore protein zw10-like n=1 Tax=Holothuria leucospilota TaxID=206669 RepID=A0A9Q1CFE4_HOLLE|nr:Centromere/kinetochore protein zw10-like [Holothuria leucospilota]
MASLVTNVLADTGLLEKEDLSKRMKKLFTQVDDLKGEVHQSVNERYVQFHPSLDTMAALKTRVTGIENDILDLKKTLKLETKVKLKDLTEMKGEMDETCATVALLQLLFEIHNDLKQFHDYLGTKQYIESAGVLQKLRENIEILSSSPFCDHQIVSALHTETVTREEILKDHLNQMWSECISFHKVDGGLGSALTIAKDPQLLSMLQAMHTMGELKWKFNSFAKHFQENILNCIIEEPKTGLMSEINQEALVIRITLEEKASNVKAPEDTYNQLLDALSLLHKLFSRCEFRTDETSFVSLMKMLGNLVWSGLCDSLIHHCLMPSVPTSANELENYKCTIEATESFENSLRKLDFIGDEKPLLEYAADVHIHFARRKCQEILMRARHLMKQDLYTTVDVGQVKDESRNISGCFPACKISKSTQDLMALAEDTLRQASSGGAPQLIATVRNLFGIFVDVVPTFHRQSLYDLPQVSALFHNNCMYIAHNLKTLGHRYRYTLPSPYCDSIISFVDLVPTFTKMAAEIFFSQMRNQRDQLMESLAMARGFQDVASDDIYPDAEKAIKQVLHQLELLHSVWSDVLPTKSFIKAMSALIGTVLHDVVEKVTSLEDISADDASQLHGLLTKIKVKIPGLLKPKHFQEPVVAAVHIKLWTTFSELLFILEASMKDIVERWACGKGPLAAVFDPVQVKSLIRALFQNTERRAEALSNIRLT